MCTSKPRTENASTDWIVLDVKRPFVDFPGGLCAGVRVRARRGVGAGVTVSACVRVSWRAGVRVRQCLLFCFCSCLFVSFPLVTAKHDRTHSQTLSPSQTFFCYFFGVFAHPPCAVAVVLDVVKIPTRVPTLEGQRDV